MGRDFALISINYIGFNSLKLDVQAISANNMTNLLLLSRRVLNFASKNNLMGLWKKSVVVYSLFLKVLACHKSNTRVDAKHVTASTDAPNVDDSLHCPRF